MFEHTFRTQKVLHVPFEPFVSIAEPKGRRHASTPRRRVRRSCAPRSRACSAGRRTACACKVPFIGGGYGSKLYIKLEALVDGAVAARPPAGEDRADDGGAVLPITKHPSTLRIKSGVDQDGRITARKCEVFWNGGAYADIGPRVTQKSGFTAAGPLRHRERVDRLLRALHQPAAGGRAARLRHPAAGVGLREPHRHDRARAQARSGGIPPQEYPARRAAAGDRHDPARTRQSSRCSTRLVERMDWAKPFDRGSGDGAARPRLRASPSRRRSRRPRRSRW